MKSAVGFLKQLEQIIGPTAEELLQHKCSTIPAGMLHRPAPDSYDSLWPLTDHSPRVLCSLAAIYNHGRLGGTGYLSILPVDQAVSFSAGAVFGEQPSYMDGGQLLELAIEGGCSAIATTFGVLGSLSRRFAHRIPFICKLNYSEMLSYPNRGDQTMFGTVRRAWELGAVAIGATVYFGSEEAHRQIVEVSQAFEAAHSLGLATVLWAYVRNDAIVSPTLDGTLAADVTGQANHIAATLMADIIKQKLPEACDAFTALHFGAPSDLLYNKLLSDHPIDRTRYQVANCYLGRIGLISSGGPSEGEGDLASALRTAIINKRAGGSGLMLGRKAFSRPMAEGIELLHAVQDVYLNPLVRIA